MFEGVLIAILVIIGLVMLWCQTQALGNVKEGVRTDFNLRLFFKPELFDEKGKRYRKIYLLLFIPEIALIVIICFFMIISDQ